MHGETMEHRCCQTQRCRFTSKKEPTASHGENHIHGPECVRHKTQKIRLVHNRTQYKFIFFSHNSKIVQKHSLKSVQYGTGPHVKTFKQKKF